MVNGNVFKIDAPIDQLHCQLDSFEMATLSVDIMGGSLMETELV